MHLERSAKMWLLTLFTNLFNKVKIVNLWNKSGNEMSKLNISGSDVFRFFFIYKHGSKTKRKLMLFC